MEIVTDLQVPHAHERLRSLLDEGAKVLDVGCGYGVIGQFLSSGGIQVDGLEPDPERAAQASGRLRHVVTGAAGDAAPDPPYDAVLFLDVIEHLHDVGSALMWAAGLLRPAGVIYTSVPNAAHITARKKLALGDWSYHDAGVFDRTHVHFYDIMTMGRIGAGVGLLETNRWYTYSVPRLWPLPRAWSCRRWPNLLADHALIAWRSPTPGPRP